MAIAMLATPSAATPADADHCFVVFVEPRRGPVGTEFVIGQGSGQAGVVTLFHDGVRARRVAVGGRDGEEFRFVATAADIGSWRAYLRIPDGDRPCGPNALFTVTAAPDTATAEPTSRPDHDPMPAIPVLALAAAAGLGVGLRRLSRA
jgi:hypothetical protein